MKMLACIWGSSFQPSPQINPCSRKDFVFSPLQMGRRPASLVNILLLLLLLALHPLVFSFSCFTCNTSVDKDDTEPCEQKTEECPNGTTGVQSCSTLLYFSNRAEPGRPHVRKFCTSPGLPLGSVLERFPLKTANGAGFCQSVDRWISLQAKLTSASVKARRLIRRFSHAHAAKTSSSHLTPTEAAQVAFQQLERRRRRKAGDTPVGANPPAPPQSHSSTLLCVCTQPLCNDGDFQEILGRSLLGDIRNNGINRKAKFEIEEEGGVLLSAPKEVPRRL